MVQWSLELWKEKRDLEGKLRRKGVRGRLDSIRKVNGYALCLDIEQENSLCWTIVYANKYF